MEDLDALTDGSLEDDFITLVSQNFPKDMFIQSASIMIGDDWKEVGRKILTEGEHKDLMEKFEKYVD